MSYKVTKVILKMNNGDKKVMKEPIITHDLEELREELNKQYVCISILFVYEETTETVPDEETTETAQADENIRDN